VRGHRASALNRHAPLGDLGVHFDFPDRLEDSRAGAAGARECYLE
jgi:hypothetical protein